MDLGAAEGGLPDTSDVEARGALEQARAELAEAQRVAHVGSWTLDAATGVFAWSDELYRIFGREPGSPIDPFDAAAARHDAASRETRDALYARTLRTGEPWTVEYPLVRPDGSRRHVVARGEAVRDASGGITGLRGTVQDVTEQVEAREALVTSEERFRLIAENAADVVWRGSTDGVVEWVSPAITAFAGWRPEQLIGRPFADVVDPDDLPIVRTVQERLIAGEEGRFEARVRTATGGVRWAEFLVRPVRDLAGTVVGRAGGLRDIQAEHDIRAALALQTADLEEARDIARMGTWRRELATGTTRWSPQMYRLFGIDPDGPPLAPAEMDARLTPESLERRTAASARAAATGEPFETELEIRRSDGGTTWLIQRGVVDKGPDGTITGYHGVAFDITERKLHEEVLRASEELYRGLVETISEGIVVQQADGTIVASNARATEILGLTHDEVTGLTSFDPRWEARHADGSPMPGEEHPATITLRTGRPCRDVFMDLAHADGRRISILINSAPLTDAEGRVTAVMAAFRDVVGGAVSGATLAIADVTEAEAIEDQLRRETDRHRALVGESRDGVIRVTDDTVVLEANPAFCAMLGVRAEDLVGSALRDRYAPQDARPPHFPGREPGQPRVGWRILTRADGSLLHTQWSAVRLEDGTTLASLRDMTREVELEERLERSARLETIGRLTGGVVHDFNNILTAITGSAEFLADAVPPDDPRRRDVDAIRDAGDRAADLTRQLLAFGRADATRGGDAAPATDLDASLAALAPMLRRTLGDAIELRLDLGDGPEPIGIARSAIEQLAVNLAVNARDAMPDGGVITIQTREHDLTPEDRASHPEAAGRSFARLSVIDTGSGIAPDVLPHIFDALYTTKAAGEGTGLGLATVARIVDDAGGWIEVATEVGRGTTFLAALPHVAAGPSSDAATSADAAAPGGSETILVVEDDAAALQVTVRQLRSLGYSVVARSDPAQAVTLLAAGPTIDLLVADIGMPGISGLDIADAFVEGHPGQPVLLVSGTPPSEATSRRLAQPGRAFLRKPFDRRALAVAVRAALDGTQPR